MATRTTMIGEIANLSARERWLISFHRGGEGNMQPEPDKLAALLDTVRAFGLVALMLAVAGLYGVQSYAVAQRFKEIGIRMAMGARSWQVSAGIVRQGTMLAVIGIGLGLPIALALGGIVEGMLFGVEARDPATLLSVAAVLLMTSMAASYLPARRAARVEPMAVLREE